MFLEMKTPFPGMDPYLEPHWLDVQTSWSPMRPTS
jgi:hypothetical protein